MSGPHQSGWSDEELIALRDLRYSDRALGPGSQTRGQSKGNQGKGQAAPPPARPRQQQPPRRATSTRREPPPQAARSTPPPQRSRQVRQAPLPTNGLPPSRPRTTARGQDGGAYNRRSEQDAFLARAGHAVGREPHVARKEINLRNFLPGKDKSQVFEELAIDMRMPVRNATIGVFSRKGGVGKTTITAYLGLMLARVRRTPIVAIDGDSEAGSLGWMLAPDAPTTLEALAAMPHKPRSLREYSRFVVPAQDGLDLILGDTVECRPLNQGGLSATVDSLAATYDVTLFDTGSGVTHSAGRTLINKSRVLLLIMGPSVDSVRAAERTLAWLDDRDDAVMPPTDVIAVINGIPSSMGESQIVDIERLFDHRCAAVIRIPWDEYLAAGSTEAAIHELSRPTQQALMQLAATSVRLLARTTPLELGARGRYES